MGDRKIKKHPYKTFQGKNLAPLTLEDTHKNKVAAKRNLKTGLSPYTGAWESTQIAHLLKRCSFGIQKSELDQLSGMTMEEAVDFITQPSPNNSLPINNYSNYGNDPHVAPGETWVEKPYGDGVEFLRVFSLKNWMLESYLTTGLSIHPKMALFWHNLIPTQFFIFEFANLSYTYFKVLDNNALGNYKDIIKQITKDPAMLEYLNGAYNIKEAPDENYARELQELFTVGKGPNSNYTEQDVYEAARVLTGWSIDYAAAFNEGDIKHVYYSGNHDTGDKTFSEFYNNRVIQGKSGDAGMEETDELIDMILETNEAALYICRRLYNFFVYHEIDESTEENVIIPLAQLFRDNNYDIQPVVRALLKSEHFYDDANIGAYVKNPLDHMVGLLRTFDTEVPADEMGFDFLWELYFLTNDLGMGIGDPPSVSGWQAYYQIPSFDKLWINSDTILKRASYQDYMIYDKIDVIKFAETLDNPEDPNALITESNLLLQGIALSEETMHDLKQNLLGGQIDDHYWTDAWNQYLASPDNEEHRSTVMNRLQSMFRQSFQLAEFQLT